MSMGHAPAAPLFGPAGRGESFKTRGFKAMADVPDYLAEFGLTRQMIEKRFAFYTDDGRWPISD